MSSIVIETELDLHHVRTVRQSKSAAVKRDQRYEIWIRRQSELQPVKCMDQQQQQQQAY